MRHLLFAALSFTLAACTTFTSTDTAGLAPTATDGSDGSDVVDDATGADAGTGDTGLEGACCFAGQCRQLGAIACAALTGDFSAGETCQSVGCAPTCVSYCSEFMDSCATVSNDYASLADCTTFCDRHARWESGTFEDQTGNTIGCRTYHAEFANDPDQDRAFHCEHAGVSGGDICGSWCLNYCQLAVNICGDRIFDNTEECLTACRDFPDDGQVDDTTGDTVQCRIYHLTAAARSPRAVDDHCAHASPESVEGTCVGLPPAP